MYKLYFDGASRDNPGKSASAYVIYDNNDKRIQYGYYVFPRDATNNEAEYMGLVAGLEASTSLNITSLHVFGDSKLVLECVFGTWKSRKDTLKPYCQHAKNLIKKQITEIEWDWIERDINTIADALCNKALDNNSSKNEQYFKLPEYPEEEKEVEEKDDKMSTKEMLKEILKQLANINERLNKLEEPKLEQSLKKKDLPTNCGSRWTTEQETSMLEAIAKNTSIHDIAEKMNRTYGGIRSRLLIIARNMIVNENKTYEEVSKITSLSIDCIKKDKLNYPFT
jgi:ribonuclease HI